MVAPDMNIETGKLSIDSSNGYVYFCNSAHSLASTCGKVYYHRHVASLKLGRWLTSSEDVHHIDGNKQNNTPDNLVVMTHIEHAREHKPLVTERQCPVCSTLFTPYVNKSIYCSTTCSQAAQQRFVISKSALASLVKAMPVAEIARMYKVSGHTVAKRCKRLGIPVPKRGY